MGRPAAGRTLKKRAKPALTASIITALAPVTGATHHELLWQWSLSKILLHLHAVAVANGNGTRWTTADPAAALALRTALGALSATPPPIDDPFADAGED